MANGDNKTKNILNDILLFYEKLRDKDIRYTFH